MHVFKTTMEINSKYDQSLVNLFQYFSLNWHTQQRYQNVLRDFIANKCSYGPTTTQQRIHNRIPAGFIPTINSKINQLNTNSDLELFKSFVRDSKNQINSIQSKYIREKRPQSTPQHSTNTRQPSFNWLGF
jgi:hypothetical protein